MNNLLPVNDTTNKQRLSRKNSSKSFNNIPEYTNTHVNSESSLKCIDIKFEDEANACPEHPIECKSCISLKDMIVVEKKNMSHSTHSDTHTEIFIGSNCSQGLTSKLFCCIRIKCRNK